jgi:hypothetical protein
MLIHSIKNTNTSNYNLPKINFTAHPDFYKFNSTKSCYFRRGVVALANNEGYADIENLFCKIFQSKLNKPKKMLIIGIGHSQEPFSYLASIKGIIKSNPLNKAVDLYVVDLQSKPKYNELRLNAFPNLFPYEKFPKYASKSFIKDVKFPNTEPNNLSPIKYYIYTQMHKPAHPSKDYRVNDEILKFVNEAYNNPEKSKWDSRIQEVITNFSDNEFDIISANNVFGYLSDNDYAKTMKQIKRILKTEDGYFISDPYFQDVQNSEILSTFKELYLGIYQKI